MVVAADPAIPRPAAAEARAVLPCQAEGVVGRDPDQAEAAVVGAVLRLTWAHPGVGAEAAAPRREEAVEEAVVLPQALTRQGAAAGEGACCWEQAEEQEEVEGLQQESWAQVLL